MLRDFCSPIIVMWLWPSHGCVCERARCCCSIRRPANKKCLRSHGFQMLRDHTWTAMHTMHIMHRRAALGPHGHLLGGTEICARRAYTIRDQNKKKHKQKKKKLKK